jgi:hypothetical protein
VFDCLSRNPDNVSTKPQIREPSRLDPAIHGAVETWSCSANSRTVNPIRFASALLVSNSAKPCWSRPVGGSVEVKDCRGLATCGDPCWSTHPLSGAEGHWFESRFTCSDSAELRSRVNLPMHVTRSFLLVVLGTTALGLTRCSPQPVCAQQPTIEMCPNASGDAGFCPEFEFCMTDAGLPQCVSQRGEGAPCTGPDECLSGTCIAGTCGPPPHGC